MTLDPYKTLGIGRDATPEEVDAAFKRCAKAAHPDCGGSEEAFIRTKTAHCILSDPQRRAHFDATGECEDAPIDNGDQAAMQLIAAMLGALLVRDDDVFQLDIPALMTRELLKRQQEAEKSIRTMQRAESRAQRMQKLFKRKGDGDNRLARMLEWHANTARQQIAADRKNIEHAARAIEILKDYDFERDGPIDQWFLLQASQAQSQAQAYASRNGLLGW
jgi:curved DNA-binding protein CbpA